MDALLENAYERFLSERENEREHLAVPAAGRSLPELFRNAVLGLAVADALGVPYECGWRDRYTVTDMTGFEPGMPGYHKEAIPVGTWSDDSALTFATIDSRRSRGGWDGADMLGKFCAWFYDDAYVPVGQKRFGEGKITVSALENFRAGAAPEKCGIDADTALGNGSLMRILPLAFYPHTTADIVSIASLTHANPLGIMACVCYVEIAEALISGKTKEEAVRGERFPEHEAFARMGSIDSVGRDDIKSSGNVIETLEAALWCLLMTDSYRDCVLRAVNLGRDTDTVAAVAGGLAGMYHSGDKGIPDEWIKKMQPGYEQYLDL